jgi:hypothetical protein
MASPLVGAGSPALAFSVQNACQAGWNPSLSRNGSSTMSATRSSWLWASRWPTAVTTTIRLLEQQHVEQRPLAATGTVSKAALRVRIAFSY